MKTLLILSLLTLRLFALELNPILLRAQASIFPKIMLLDKDVSEKTPNGAVTLAIVYNTHEKEYAQNFKRLVDKEYGGSIDSYKFEVTLLDVNDQTPLKIATSYYFFDLEEARKGKLLTKAMQSKRICFAYDYKDFKENALISLILKEKTYIYLNKTSLNDYDVKFIPIFYKIVKAIE